MVMLFNIKREAYVAGRGSIATDILPESIKEEVMSEGKDQVRKYS